MTTCQRCGTERTPSGYCGAQGQHAMCALRAELRGVKAERDAALVQVAEWCASAEDHRLLTAEIARLTGCLLRANASMEEVERTGYLRLDAMESELRDLRAAVLAIAAEMTHEDRHVRHGAWAVRLREAVGK